jgi:hypothetical protein
MSSCFYKHFFKLSQSSFHWGGRKIALTVIVSLGRKEDA